MIEGGCVKNWVHLIRTGYSVTSIMVVPVAASDPSPNDSYDDRSGGDPDFTVIFSMSHLVSDGMAYLDILSMI